MSTKVPQNKEDQEIDLLQIPQKISDFFGSVSTSIFKGIQFFVRNKVLVLALILVGFGMGWYLDSNKKIFDNQIIVTPNFESVDYLYSKIDLLQSKIAYGDTLFLKNVVGIKKPKAIKKIAIKPIADVYGFVENKEQNFELLKLIAEDGDINKVLIDNVTSKNYTYHTISFTTNELTDEENVVQPILNYLNNSKYFSTVQKIGLKNLDQEIAQNDTIIKQINDVLASFTSNKKSVQKDGKLVYYNENTQLNDLIKTKQYLIGEQGKNRVKLVRYDKTIKQINTVLNLKKTNFISGNLSLILPLLFVLLFVASHSFLAFYKKQSLITESKKE
ncbi:hypothetical protein [Flavobacterium sp. IMCC34518]|uniref:hypothetical protein n=1 Tax=Flavobacterium sp. IMCC34518 TaxID=3003623 RepID=UPI0024825EC7|nr:hypothetical protein [Flavobacterium sp. IMCC34518]